MLDDRLRGSPTSAARSRRGRQGQGGGWYREDDDTDLVLPSVPWDDPTWSANEHSFGVLLDRYVEPGMRVLEVGAARCWGALHMVPRGVDYVATDILADPVIGLGRGEFYERHVGLRPRAGRRREPSLRRPLVRPHLLRCEPAPRARRAPHGEGDGTRDAPRRRRAALNEGTRAGRERRQPAAGVREAYGINEHVHTMWAYVGAFLAAGVAITRLEQAEGYEEVSKRRKLRHVLRVPLAGRTAATLLTQNLSEYSGITIFGRRVA